MKTAMEKKLDKEILNLLKVNPALKKINENRKQAKLDPKVIQKIEKYYIDNRDKILEVKSKFYN